MVVGYFVLGNHDEKKARVKIQSKFKKLVSFDCLVNRILFEGKWYKTMLNG